MTPDEQQDALDEWAERASESLTAIAILVAIATEDDHED